MADLQNRKFKLRVTYKKVGVAAWLSQLELARALERQVRRSGLPYAVSEGFSPHMRISFGPALSVGITGERQIFDVLLRDYIAPEKCLKALKDVCQTCLEPVECVYVDNKETIPQDFVSNYEVLIDGNISKLKIPETISVFKKRKEKTFNVADFLDQDIKITKTSQGTKLEFCLKQSESGSLNPSKFLDEVLKTSGKSNALIISFKKL